MDPLRYNIRWVQRTFSSTTTTEDLLSPERDAGTLSPRDYEAAVAFFPGAHRRYNLIGGALGIPAYFMVPKPFRGTPRSYGVVMGASMVGYMVGQAMTVAAHISFVKSIEDPSGFARAMDNIQKQSGIPLPQSPLIVRQGKTMALEHHEDGNGLPEKDSSFPSTDKESRPPATSDQGNSSPQAHPHSRWDEIRSINAKGARNSTWDAIRQSHERPRVPTSSTPSTKNVDLERFGDDERRLEQAKFDELLERERNFKG